MPGTVFNEKTKVCDWSENAQRHNCARVKNFIENGIAEQLKALKMDVHVFKNVDSIQQRDGANQLIDVGIDGKPNEDVKNDEISEQKLEKVKSTVDETIEEMS